MRTRLLRPDFWADDVMAGLPPVVRLTFMGLWGLSDDAGFFDWKPRQIGAELYRYQSAASRERQIDAHLERLIEAKRIEHLDCGEHGRIPSMERHRIQSGRHSFGVRDEHVQHTAGRGGTRNSTAGRVPLVTVTSTDTESESLAGARNGSIEPTEKRGAPMASMNPELGKWAKA